MSELSSFRVGVRDHGSPALSKLIRAVGASPDAAAVPGVRLRALLKNTGHMLRRL